MADDTTQTPPAAPSAPAPAWYTGLDAEAVGHLQNRGWDKLDAPAAAAAAIQAFRGVEKFVGMPADRVARLPTGPTDTEGWAALNQRLGVPTAAAGYSFPEIKRANGAELDAGFVTQMQTAALTAGLRPDQAQRVTAEFVKHLDTTAASDTLQKTQRFEADMNRLKAEWGGQFEHNDFVASQAIAKLGLAPDMLQALKE